MPAAGRHQSPTDGHASDGLVVAAHGRRGILDRSGRRHPFQIQGRRLRPVCGDLVTAEARPGSETLIVTGIVPRRNQLAREPQRPSNAEVLAANLTRIVVVCAPRPAPDLMLLDRYLCAAELMGCEPAVIWNKSDLEPAPRDLADEVCRLGYPFLALSAHGSAQPDGLPALLRGHTSILVGQSGVGKSSLANALVPTAGADVGDLSGHSGTGTHTTTAVLMYRLACGGWLVDAPGVRSFVPAIDSGAHVADGFVDVRAQAQGCRFTDCQHVEEPGCAVKAAVAAGTLGRRRYASYCELLAAATRTRTAHPAR